MLIFTNVSNDNYKIIMAKFKKEFVKELKLLITNKILDLDLQFPKKSTGWVRLNSDHRVLNSIYLNGIDVGKSTGYKSEVILKFKHRDFHYRKPDYIFGGIYLCADGVNEFRYDANMNLESVYIKGPFETPTKEDVEEVIKDMDKQDKDHILSVIKEWKNTQDILDNKNNDNSEYISAYAIEKDKKKVKMPYLISKKEVPLDSSFESSRAYKQIRKITSKFNIRKPVYWGCKAIVENNKLYKDNILYITVE